MGMEKLFEVDKLLFQEDELLLQFYEQDRALRDRTTTGSAEGNIADSQRPVL